jgi:3-phosphoshikimate 1-carboxyvinyltransferase
VIHGDPADAPGPAPVTPAGSLRGSLRLPSDKSIAHRALLFTAMAEGEASVTLYHPGADVLSTLGLIEKLGAVRTVQHAAEGRLLVTIRGGGQPGAARLPGAGDEDLECGNSGTTMRLAMGALAGRPARACLDGDDSLSRRPMERVAAPLRAMGAGVTTTGGHAPVTVTGVAPLRAVDLALPVASAQVLGSLLLAGLAATGRTSVTVPGPTRDHTERMLGWLSAPVRRDGRTSTADGPAGFRARDITVPGDISAAAAWLVAGALHPRAELHLEGVGLNPSRLAVVDVLREMGAEIEVSPDLAPDAGPEPVGRISVRGGRPLRAISIGGARVADLIDELPLLGVAMAGAEGQGELRDAGELRVKESDRIALVVAGLAAIGARVEELPDGWRVRRGEPREAAITTAGDHRIAMAFAIASLAGVAGAVTIDDRACAAVSYPGFWDHLAAVGT